MKKNYISPKTNVFNVIEEQIIASSAASSFSIGVDDSETISDMIQSLGREDASNSSLWDQGW